MGGGTHCTFVVVQTVLMVTVWVSMSVVPSSDFVSGRVISVEDRVKVFIFFLSFPCFSY